MFYVSFITWFHIVRMLGYPPEAEMVSNRLHVQVVGALKVHFQNQPILVLPISCVLDSNHHILLFVLYLLAN